MADYNFEGLSTRSFEQLVQAIASKVIGPNVVIYGDGRDGGREATFDGPVPFPSDKAGWDGYGVIQAKFRQRTQDTKADGDWALQQLRQELADFADPSKGRKKPDYYIFATNVVLTPYPEKGSKDRAAAVFEEFKDTVPLKGHAVWDYDQLRVFLDGQEDIRRSYAAWITPGDVLGEVIRWLRPKTPDFEQTLTRFLQEDLLADQYANLEKRRHASDDPVPIARVFVDMPAFDEPRAEPPQESEEDGRLPPGFIGDLLAVASERLDPRSQSPRPAETRNVEEGQRRKEPGRFVLVGGPGQGKTTIGQFLCQLFRASILKEKDETLFEPDVTLALKAITSQAGGKGTPLPGARRFPIRIELSEFAKALASGEGGAVGSLIEYVVERIRKKTTRRVSVEDFRAWLGAYPWLLVLDGLDEVPASSNREEVLKAIRSFRIEARECNADLLVVATTRPQGYSKDFDPAFFDHKYLAPLSVARALYYGRGLVEARYPGDHDRREKVIGRLEQASKVPATSRLMRSPLQVTIMTTLVDGAGQPPQERWELFRSYYKKIYDREVEGGIEVLRTYRTEIDFIHKRVGLLLQVESEQSGKTEARLSSEDFAAVVEGRLREKGHEGDDCVRLKEEIIRVAAQRLVFLVGLEANQVGFEIRSLQEFMAAEGLMEGSDRDVRNRLREIAPVSHWRNVFLFAAGRCLVERDYLLDTIHKICAELNEFPADPVARATLAGSQLALDLLEDIPARQQPGEARLHARAAMRLLDLPPGETHVRLANLYDPVLETVYREELSARLDRADFPHTLGAWVCLLRLIQNGVPWAAALGETRWPTDSASNVHLLRATNQFMPHGWSESKAVFSDNFWLLSKLVSALPLIPPLELVRITEFDPHSILSFGKDVGDPLARVLHGLSDLAETAAPIATPEGTQRAFDLSLVGVQPEHEELAPHLREVAGHSPYLAALYAAARFIDSPSRSTLASALRQLAVTWRPDIVGWLGVTTPWPLGKCLGAWWAEVTSPEELQRLALRAEAGELGDVEDWLEAERRWAAFGITSADIEHMTDERFPYDKSIARKGHPLYYLGWSIAHTVALRPVLVQLLETYRRLGDRKSRCHVASWIQRMLTIRELRGENTYLTLQELQRLLDDIASIGRVIDLVEILPLVPDDITRDSWRDFFDHVGRYAEIDANRNARVLLSPLVNEFNRHPERLGLLRLISLLATPSDSLPIPREALKPESMPDRIFKEAAIVVRLMQGNLGPDEIRALAAQTPSLLGEREDSTGRLRELLGNPPTTPEFDAFLVELSRVLPPGRWEVARDVVGSLNRSLRRRMSGLRSLEVWERLALPENLKPLLPG